MNRLSNQNGLTLIELLFAAGLTSVVVLAVAASLELMTKASYRNRVLTTRNSLSNNLRKEIADLNVLRKSLLQPDNVENGFLACVCGSPDGCATGVSKPFSLFLPGTDTSIPYQTYVDADGSPCDSTARNCNFIVETKYSASCMPNMPDPNPSPPLNCITPAEFVSISFSIKENPAAQGATLTFEPIQGAAFVQVADITGPSGGGLCP